MKDINKITQVSMKLKNEESNSETAELGLKIKVKSSKNSIYVEVLQSISTSRERNSLQGFNFNLEDPVTGNLIRASTVLKLILRVEMKFQN